MFFNTEKHSRRSPPIPKSFLTTNIKYKQKRNSVMSDSETRANVVGSFNNFKFLQVSSYTTVIKQALNIYS